MANAWRPLIEEVHGGWRYRWTHGVTRRANSALAFESTEAVDQLVTRAEDFYAERGAPTLVQVSTASAPPALPAYLRSRGYRSTARTLVEEAATRVVLERTHSRLDVEVTDHLTDEWFRTYWSVDSGRGRSDTDMILCRDVLLAPELPMAFAAVRCEGTVVGVGQLVMERGWGGLQCMATSNSCRRRGVASAVLHGLASEATRLGIGNMYLAVMVDNEAAADLYASAGFELVHEYSYFTDKDG